MKVGEVKQMTYIGIQVTVSKNEYDYSVKLPSGQTETVKTITGFKDIKPSNK